jgi:hypothetical protein
MCLLLRGNVNFCGVTARSASYALLMVPVNFVVGSDTILSSVILPANYAFAMVPVNFVLARLVILSSVILPANYAFDI